MYTNIMRRVLQFENNYIELRLLQKPCSQQIIVSKNGQQPPLRMLTKKLKKNKKTITTYITQTQKIYTQQIAFNRPKPTTKSPSLFIPIQPPTIPDEPDEKKATTTAQTKIVSTYIHTLSLNERNPRVRGSPRRRQDRRKRGYSHAKILRRRESRRPQDQARPSLASIPLRTAAAGAMRQPPGVRGSPSDRSPRCCGSSSSLSLSLSSLHPLDRSPRRRTALLERLCVLSGQIRIRQLTFACSFCAETKKERKNRRAQSPPRETSLQLSGGRWPRAMPGCAAFGFAAGKNCRRAAGVACSCSDATRRPAAALSPQGGRPEIYTGAE